MLKQILEDLKIQKRVSPEEFEIIKKVFLKYFEDARKWFKTNFNINSYPFIYVKDFGNKSGGKLLSLTRRYGSNDASWLLGCEEYKVKDGKFIYTKINSTNITNIIEKSDIKTLDKFFKKLIEEFPKIECKTDKDVEKFVEKVYNEIK